MIIIINLSTGKAYKLKCLMHVTLSIQTTSNQHLCYTETRESVINLAIVMAIIITVYDTPTAMTNISIKG